MSTPYNCDVVKTRRHQIFAATSLVALIAAGTAHAQTTPAFGQPVPADQSIQEIVVTGTQIRGVAPVGAPVITVGRQEIEDSGLTTTADILHDIPQVTLLGASQSTLGANQNANLNTNKDNGINIRGLGPQATLTLLDGRRTPLGGASGNVYDPSSIPTIAIGSIDVVADGASATYGSDAVAGVANIVLRKNFEGFEVEGDYGTATDYNTSKIGAIFGHKWDGGSVMLAAETNYSSLLLGSQRIGLLNCNETALGATLGCSAFAVPAGNVVVPAGATIPAGTHGVPVSSTGIGLTAAQLGGENYFNPARDVTLLPKTNRNSVVGNVQQDINKDISVWAEGYYTQDNISYLNGQLQASGALTTANPGFIPLGAGITSETADLGLDSLVGAGNRSGFERAYQAAAGADVKLPDRWAFDTYVEHNYNYEYTNTVGLNSNAERTAFACTTPGLCFDPYGPAAGNGAALGSFIGYQHFNYYQTEDLVNSKLDGPVYALPGGDIKLAVGTEIHHDSLKVLSQNDESGASTGVVSTAANFTTGRTVASVFAEAIIPVVGANNAVPFVDRLDIDLAGRYDHYSDVGGTANPKISGRWKPIPDLAIHADYGTSFRAPTLCDTNPGCSAADLATTTAYGPGVNVITILGGNSAVKPETATTYSIGADYKPSWLMGFSATINYYNIDYKNVIGTPGQSGGATVLTNPLYASLVIHNPTQAQINYYTSKPSFTSVPFPTTQGVVSDIILGTRQNAGAVKTDGIDFTADYDWANSLGRWSAGINGNYTFAYNYEVLAGLGFVNSVNEANYPVSFRSRARFSWSKNDLTAVGYLNYTGSYRVVGLAYAAQNTSVDAYTTVDATLIYRLRKSGYLNGYASNVTLSISAQNLFNSGPPFALITNDQEFDSQQASALGREVTFSIRKAF
jgi:iron complex outermembrane receptor protein